MMSFIITTIVLMFNGFKKEQWHMLGSRAIAVRTSALLEATIAHYFTPEGAILPIPIHIFVVMSISTIISIAVVVPFSPDCY